MVHRRGSTAVPRIRLEHSITIMAIDRVISQTTAGSRRREFNVGRLGSGRGVVTPCFFLDFERSGVRSLPGSAVSASIIKAEICRKSGGGHSCVSDFKILKLPPPVFKSLMLPPLLRFSFSPMVE